MTAERRPGTMRAHVARALGVAGAILVYPAGMGLTGSGMAAAVVAAAAGVTIVWLFQTRRILDLDPAACSPRLKVASGLATVLALAQLARLAVFAVAPERPAYSFSPGSTWEIEHSCLTAYHVAAQASSSTGDIYDDALYAVPQANPQAPRQPHRIGSFNVDPYEYPPPFLLLPRALHLLTPEFADLRMLWFALNGAVLIAGLVAVAGFLGGGVGTRALLLAPFVMLSLPNLSTLQKGNVQMVVITASLLAMILFARGRHAWGALLLAFAIVSKIYPGMLVVYLLARRDWRAVAWTTVMSVGLVLAALIDMGWQPFAAFLGHLSGLLGGEAFPALRRPVAMAINLSIPGFVFKLGLFGIPGMSFAASKLVGWIYTPVAIGATIWLARRAPRGGEQALAWMAVLLLATLRSPFLPAAYGVIPVIWLLTLLVAERGGRLAAPAVALLAYAGLNLYWPLDWPIDPRLLTVVMLAPLGITLALVARVLRQAPRQPLS